MHPAGSIAAAAVALALGAPAVLAAEEAAPGAPVGEPAGPPPATVALEPAPNLPPVALFGASSDSLTAGGSVTFDARGSRDEDGTIVRHSWDLDGDGRFETETGTTPTAQGSYPLPGTVRVRLRVADDRGAEGESFLDVTAHPLPTPTPAAGATRPQPGGAEPATAPRAGKRHSAAAAVAAPRRDRRDSPRISAAASTAVSIRNFAFAPSTVNVKVGDTVTWTNRDSEGHSATARGNFDTGILAKGRSGSHTFTRAGTFSYICTPHPFMKGKVVVAAAGGSSGSAGSAGSGGTGSGTTPDAAAAGDTSVGGGDSTASAGAGGAGGGSLPRTGFAIASIVLIGAGSVGSGSVLRALMRRRDGDA